MEKRPAHRPKDPDARHYKFVTRFDKLLIDAWRPYAMIYAAKHGIKWPSRVVEVALRDFMKRNPV